jgi:hypothetical protein
LEAIMLRTQAPFPEVGSYALLIDRNLPAGQQRGELVRILRKAPISEQTTVAFPLRTGASGTRVVDHADLIDGTPLTGPEERELADLDRDLRGRLKFTAKQKAIAARRDALRSRLIWSQLYRAELAKAEALDGRQQRSVGQLLPHDIEQRTAA